MNSENVVGAILRANNDNTVTRPSGDGLPVGLSLPAATGHGSLHSAAAIRARLPSPQTTNGGSQAIQHLCVHSCR